MMTKKYGRLRFDERIEIEKLLSHKRRLQTLQQCLTAAKAPFKER